MAHHNLIADSISESIEMYLLRIALLQQNLDLVPVPLLAKDLSVSSASANEMCRKLANKTLLIYEPYKGVTLTDEGAILANQVLRRRRLWEVFLVEKLNMTPQEAEEAACRFEHVTSTDISERLASFLEHPTASPKSEPIPTAISDFEDEWCSCALNELNVGERGRVVFNKSIDTVTRNFLEQHGIRIGTEIEVLVIAPDNTMLVKFDEHRVSLSSYLTAEIKISRLEKE